jgi:glycosyltransferase involved in cell wall biosynthesis
LVAFISPFSESGAATNRALYLSSSFPSRLIILPKNDKYGTSSDKDFFYFPIVNKSFLKLPLWWVKTTLKLLDYRPDVVIFLKASLFTVVPAFAYKLLTSRPIIFDCDEWDAATLKDNSESYFKILLTDYLARFSIEHSDRIIYCNTLVRSEKIPLLDHPKLVYIPNGADTKQFKPMKTKHKGFNVMFVGMLHKIQHLKSLIDAIDNLRDTDVYCTIIGDGPKRNEFESIIDERGLTFKFNFMGHIPHEILPAAMSTADVFVLPFEEIEGIRYQCNIKLFEYMASGKPVIATDVGDVAKILGYGDYGRIVSSTKISSAIIECHSGCRTMVNKARKEAVRKYDWKVLSDTLMQHVIMLNEEKYVSDNFGVLS